MYTEILTIISWIKRNRKIVSKAILIALVALSVASSIFLYKQNKKLSEGLEMAQNNIEAYQGIINGSQQANNVLKLDMTRLKDQNDSLLHKLDSVARKNKIKPSHINTAATQTQEIYVNKSKGVRGQDIVKTIIKDSVYKDTINYNDLTTVEYTIGKDTVNIRLKVNNTQYLYIYKKKQYKNKKSFFKRLFTLDFKKVTVYKYDIINTNELLKTSDVRVVETNQK